MKFEPNYVTPDGVFEVQINMDKLIYETIPQKANWTAKNITYNTVNVYNKKTFSFSNKSLYINKQRRLYFKGKPKGYMGKTKNYFIDELIKADMVEKVVEDDNC